MGTVKEAVRRYWDARPCGTVGLVHPEATLGYYEEALEVRKRLAPFVDGFAEFDKWTGMKVLEVGCGIGSDLCRFAEAGAVVTGIDLSKRSADLAKKRLEFCKLRGTAFEGDAERIPFKDGTFDLVYSLGVLHHTPDIGRAINEMHRVLRPRGEIRAMLYHRHSVVSLQMYLRFGLFVGRPFRSLADIFASHHESPGTRVYSVSEVRKIFASFRDLETKAIITSYDLRYARDRYLPHWVGECLPQCFGFNILVKGKK